MWPCLVKASLGAGPAGADIFSHGSWASRQLRCCRASRPQEPLLFFLLAFCLAKASRLFTLGRARYRGNASVFPRILASRKVWSCTISFVARVLHTWCSCSARGRLFGAVAQRKPGLEVGPWAFDIVERHAVNSCHELS